MDIAPHVCGVNFSNSFILKTDQNKIIKISYSLSQTFLESRKISNMVIKHLDVRSWEFIKTYGYLTLEVGIEQPFWVKILGKNILLKPKKKSCRCERDLICQWSTAGRIKLNLCKVFKIFVFQVWLNFLYFQPSRQCLADIFSNSIDGFKNISENLFTLYINSYYDRFMNLHPFCGRKN